MNITITYPRVLIAWSGVVCCILLFRRNQKKAVVPFFQYVDLLPKQTRAYVVLYLYRLLIISVVGGSFFVLSFPKQITTLQRTTTSGIALVIALDLSYSMEATDVLPSRLQAAKSALRSFIGTRAGDAVGLVLFAGKPFMVVPLTTDYTLLEEVIARTTIKTINQDYAGLEGTALGDAMLASMRLLENAGDSEQQTTKSILLVTDGAATIWIDPYVVAQLAAQQWITIYTIGIGERITDQVAQETQQGIDEMTLQQLADITSWTYAKATDQQALSSIMHDINQLTRSEISTEHDKNTTDMRWVALRIITVCCCLVFYRDRRTLLS